jgi:exodeoxyribonuclease V alpha subunit
MLELNPYYLLALAGWRQVDSAAMKLGIARDDERRLVGAVESALYDRLQQSHTLSSHDDLVTAVNRRLKLRQADRAIQLALEEYAIVGSRESGYQTQGAAALERGVTERIRNMLAGESPEQSTLFSEPAGETWFEGQIARVESEQGFPLNLEQRLAAAMPFKNAFSVMTGGAGVGKTTVLRVIIRLAEAQHLNVFQMALAGRAAKRMAEASGREAMTIAKFLSMVRKGTLEVPADSIVIVDEASMLDLSSFYRVLRHLPDGVRLLLVGDAVQLPPISFGLVFHRLVGSKEVPQTHLLQVHRQAASTGIPAVASAVRAFEVPDIANFEGQSVGVSFVDCAGEQVIRMLEKLTAEWEDGDWQILAATKQGPCGINAINRAFHGIATSQNTDDLVQFQVGEPVIHLVNDYDRELMNGTLGRVTAVHDGVGVTIDFEGGEHFFSSAELLDNVALAYAISVHKSQGSQFRRVIVVITPSRILDHALVYTALTRGVEQVVFVGDRSSFERAVLSPPHAHSRQVGFVI